MFLDVIRHAVVDHGIEIHAYALMDNHFHLLVHTPEPNLGVAMRDIGGIYTQRFNSRHEIDGPLFRGRYKAILVGEDSYLLSASRYIHRNPLDAGLVGSAAASKWTSYPSFLGIAPTPSWLTVGPTLEIAGSRGAYKSFVEQARDAPADQFYGKRRWASTFGTDSFRRRIEAEFAESLHPNDIELLQQIEAAVDGSLASTPHAPARASTTRRLMAASLARELGISAESIALHHGYANAATALSAIHRFRRSLAEDPVMTNNAQSLLEQFRTPRVDDQAA